MALAELIIDEMVMQETQRIITSLNYQALHQYLVEQIVPETLTHAITTRINEYCGAEEQKLSRRLILQACEQQQIADQQEAVADEQAQVKEYELIADYNAQRLALVNRQPHDDPYQQAQVASLNDLLDSEFPHREELRRQRMEERQQRHEAQAEPSCILKLSQPNYTRLLNEIGALSPLLSQKRHQLTQDVANVRYAAYLLVLEQALNQQQLQICPQEHYVLASLLTTRNICLDLEVQKQNLMALMTKHNERIYLLDERAIFEQELKTEQNELSRKYNKADSAMFSSLMVAGVSGVALAIPTFIGLATSSLSLVLVIPAALLFVVLVGALVSAFAIYERQRRELIKKIDENQDLIDQNERTLFITQGQKIDRVLDLASQIKQEKELVRQLQHQLSEKHSLLQHNYEQHTLSGYAGTLFDYQGVTPSAPAMDEDAEFNRIRPF